MNNREMNSRERKKKVEKLFEKGKRQKHLSYEEINEILPDDIFATDEIEEIFTQLDDLQIAVEDEEDNSFIVHVHEEEMEEERLALEEVRNPLRSYLKEAGETSLLTHEQEVTIARGIEETKKALFDVRLKPGNDKKATILERRLDILKAQLIQANLRLVINIAKKYSNPKLTLRDLIQEGNIGLMKAVDKFRFREGYKFSTYATWWIRQAITRAIADCSSTIRIPVHMREKSNKVNKTSRSLMHELGREPTAEELSFKLQIPPDKVRMIIKSMQREPISLETPVGDDEKTTFGDFIEDRETETPANAATYALLQDELEKVFEHLEEREEKILKLRFGIGVGYPRTLEEVGQIFNLTRERIRQIENKALEKLRISNQLNRLVAFLKWYRNSI